MFFDFYVDFYTAMYNNIKTFNAEEIQRLTGWIAVVCFLVGGNNFAYLRGERPLLVSVWLLEC